VLATSSLVANPPWSTSLNHILVMYKEVAIDIIAEYIEEVVNGAKGNAISINMRQINKWYEKRFGRSMPRKAMFRIVKMLRALHALGVLLRVGNKFIVEKGSPLWECVKEGRTRECIAEYVTKFVELVDAE